MLGYLYSVDKEAMLNYEVVVNIIDKINSVTVLILAIPYREISIKESLNKFIKTE